MILYFPYGTDAPVYYRPIITITMIVINIVVFIMLPYEQIEPYMLETGNGLHPVQWLTSNFLHAGIFHLVFNMLFLWVFGPVVEGRIGSLKMLAVYLGIGVLQCAIEQILFLGVPFAHSLGASSIIFGLAAMSFIWAPESKVHGILIIIFFLVVRIKDTETPISLIVGFFAVLEAICSIVLFGNVMTPFLHGMGAIIGLITAITMLKRNYVDCEYEDIFSVYSGAKDRAEVEANKPATIKYRQNRQKRQNLLTEEIERAINNQTPLPAFIIAQRTEQEFTDWTLPQELHVKMIQQLLGNKHGTEAVLSMRQYLERHQEQSAFISLMLAQALLAQNRPGAAIKALDSISWEGLGPEQQSAIPKIRAKAETMHRQNLEQGIYELDGS